MIKDDVKKIFGPIGIKFGGRSAPEIALSIIFQLLTLNSNLTQLYNKF